MILITGATGFLGINLLPSLIKNGYKVRCLVRPNSKNISNLDQFGVEIAYGDMTNKSSIESALDDVNVVIHLATILDSSDANIYSVNVDGAKNLVEAINDSKINLDKLVFLSSATVFKNNADLSYPKTKLLAETLFLNSGLNCIVVRPTWIYGKGSESFDNLIRNIKKFPIIPVVGNGCVKLQPVYVEDVVKLIMLLIQSNKLKTRLYAIGGSSLISFDGLLNIVSTSLKIKKMKIHIPVMLIKIFMDVIKFFSIKPPISDDFISDMTQGVTVDNSVLEEEFGFVPISFEDGFKLNMGFIE